MTQTQSQVPPGGHSVKCVAADGDQPVNLVELLLAVQLLRSRAADQSAVDKLQVVLATLCGVAIDVFQGRPWLRLDQGRMDGCRLLHLHLAGLCGPSFYTQILERQLDPALADIIEAELWAAPRRPTEFELAPDPEEDEMPSIELLAHALRLADLAQEEARRQAVTDELEEVKRGLLEHAIDSNYAKVGQATAIDGFAALQIIIDSVVPYTAQYLVAHVAATVG